MTNWLAPTALGSLAMFIFTLWTYFVVTVAWPFNPVTRVRIDVENTPVTAGEPIIALVDYCKTRDWTPREVRWSLVNDVTVILTPTPVSLPVGCHVKRLLIPTSRHIAPGHYQLQEELIYQPWPWRQFVYVRRSPVFEMRGSA